MQQSYLIASLILLILAFIQNVSFSITSRSRNRNNMTFHIIAAIFSNGVWFLTFRELVLRDMSLALFPWYCVGTVAGSLLGVKVSMWIERRVDAESDSHLKKVGADTKQLMDELLRVEERVCRLEERFPERMFDPTETRLGNWPEVVQ